MAKIYYMARIANNELYCIRTNRAQITELCEIDEDTICWFEHENDFEKIEVYGNCSEDINEIAEIIERDCMNNDFWYNYDEILEIIKNNVL